MANNSIVAEASATWANSAAAGTQVNIDVSLPYMFQPRAKYLIITQNPSAVTALTVKVKSKETFGGTSYYPELSSIAVPVNTAKATVVEGWMIGEGGRLTLSNDTALGTADGFTANIRVRQL